MNIPEQQPICTRPFEWFEVHPDGSVFVCCPAWLKRPIGNLLQQTIEAIWNGPLACEIRKSILNGSFHNCSKSHCPHLLTNSAPVTYPGAISPGEVRKALQQKEHRLSYLPRSLNLCFDYSCNLACPSCRKQVRVARGAELKQAEQIGAIIQKELLPQAQTVTLSGFGDPFGSPTYLALLKKLNSFDFPHLQQVRLHTNGQRLTPEMWQQLPGLQSLVAEIEISIDAATEPTYQLNRPGGSFFQLLSNLNFLKGCDCNRTLSMVVQQNNWREIPQFLALAQSYDADIYLSKLVNWGMFSKSEYRRRAVHLCDHPEHKDFIQLLQQVAGERAEIGNLAPLIQRSL